MTSNNERIINRRRITRRPVRTSLSNANGRPGETPVVSCIGFCWRKNSRKQCRTPVKQHADGRRDWQSLFVAPSSVSGPLTKHTRERTAISDVIKRRFAFDCRIYQRTNRIRPGTHAMGTASNCDEYLRSQEMSVNQSICCIDEHCGCVTHERLLPKTIKIH